MGLLKQLEADYDLDIIEDYLTHFGVMTGLLDKLIVNLSRDDEFDASSYELNRIFHNIKTASEYLKLSPIVKLTTIVEDITNRLKSRRGVGATASNELIDWLLLVADQMQGYLDDIENDEIYLRILNPKIIAIPNEIFN
ncbi:MULTISPECIES: phosphorelay protein [Campylobacter]|uniref:Phosphorelay protein n=1 Tax=Campylobacter vicugnae TaxID=1660076 RepID=A0ABZ2E8Y1_9BACT|nr:MULTISPECIES: phosphorelay protein [unclassified Campylobacter]MCR8689515.1 phosphorelay protein [Campylobacter sp. RM9264]MCR8701561.1 phosphorelay protein [Campylobacter sp. RM12176]